MTFSLRVYGLPVPQGRPRATVRAGHAHVYERREDKDWKAVVKAQVIAALMADPRGMPWDGALSLSLRFHLARPASLPRKVVYHVKKPDADNLAKAVKDAMTGLVYRDDSQIVALMVSKVYGDQPGVAIDAERAP